MILELVVGEDILQGIQQTTGELDVSENWGGQVEVWEIKSAVNIRSNRC